MRKFSLPLLTAFVVGESARVKAVKILLIAFLFSCISYTGFGQVTIGAATGGTTICHTTAIGSTAPSCTTLGSITVAETNSADFAAAPDVLELEPPAGWVFCTTTPPTITAAPGGDVPPGSIAAFTLTSTALTINFTPGGTINPDLLTISGLSVQPASSTAPAGYIFATITTTGITGITIGSSGDNFGPLRLIPGIITGMSAHCTGDVENYGTDPSIVTGGTWGVSNSAVASVDISGNVTFGPGTGVTNVIYTVAGCSRTFGPITVSKTPGHTYTAVLPKPDSIRDMCAWFDFQMVRNNDSIPGGVFTSGVVGGGGAVTVFGALITGHAFVQANAPGLNYITYHTPAGCIVQDTFNVFPLPTLFTGLDTICKGSTTTFVNGITGGSWTSLNTAVATVGTASGVVFGVDAGTAVIRYTLPTGCSRDTVIFVNPLPDAITGTSNMCAGQFTTLSSSPTGGVWTSSDTFVAKPSLGVPGDIEGVALGTATITYTLPTGCLVTLAVTVNPMPDPITGTLATECVGESVITLSDATPGGSWSSSNTVVASVSGSVIVKGESGGTATITYALTTGCNVTYDVTINPLPDAITGDSTVCVGVTDTVFNKVPGGSWSSSNTLIAFIDPVGYITGMTPGTLTITYTLPTGCYVTRSHTVNPLPDPITGVHILCMGYTTTLSNATPGGTWSSQNTFVATIDPAGVVTPVNPGVVTFDYTLGTGCNVSFTMTITPAPTPGYAVTVCVGNTVTISNGVKGGAWTSADVSIATVTPLPVSGDGLVTGIKAGTVVITYTVSAGCEATYTVNVLPREPIVGPNRICAGDSIVLTNAVPGGTWSTTNPAITTITPLGPDPITGDDQLKIIGVNPGGIAIINYVTASGCVSSYTVTVYPGATVTPQIDTICVGATDTLTASISGGTWLSEDVTIATVTGVSGTRAVVTGVASGTILIDYTLPTGCVAKVLLTVNAIPSPIGATAREVCQGYAVTFSNVDPGGVWTNVFNPTIGVINPGGVYTGNAPGLDTIHYTFGTGCFVTDTVRVHPLTPTTGRDTVCVGSSTTLANATAGGTWSSSDVLIAIVDASGNVTGVDSGAAIITYLLPTGCMALDTVIVNPLPDTITGADSVCVASTTTFFSSPMGGTWSSSNTGVATVDPITGIITGVAAGTATITYILPTGCERTRTVRVDALPTVILGFPYVCIDFTTTLSNATPGGLWSSSNTSIAVIDTLTGDVTTVAPGVVSIFYTLTSTGCGISTSFTVFAQPILTVTAPDMICKGATDTLIASGADLIGRPGSYLWEPGSIANDTAIVSPTVTTTYTVVGTTFYGCKDTVTTTLPVDTLLNHLTISGDDSICIGTCTQLIATGRDGSLFAWTPPKALSCAICDTTTACPTETTRYVATAIDRYGCKDSVEHTVAVMPLPVLSVYSIPDRKPLSICKRTPLQLIATGAWTYVWSPNLFLSCDTCANPVATDTFNMQYILTGYTYFGCFDSMKVPISVLDTNLNTVSNDTDICVNDSITLYVTSKSVSSNLDIPKFTWYPNFFINDVNSANPLVQPPSTTTYTLVVTENACFSDTIPVTVRVQPYPEISLTPKSQVVYVGTSVLTTVTVTNTPIETYTWRPGATVSCDTCPITKLTPTATTQYTVEVTSIYGCTSKDTVTIFVGCNNQQVYMPNTFSPNGDGKNDRFYPFGNGIKKIAQFSIYNRWGQLVYQVNNVQASDASAGWDGTYKGEVLPPDVFVYVIKAECDLGGEPFIYKGDISLVR